MRKYKYFEFEHTFDYAWWAYNKLDIYLVYFNISLKLDRVCLGTSKKERVCPYA